MTNLAELEKMAKSAARRNGDIGYAALFLASNEAGCITGPTIAVDGGQILQESLEALKD